MTIEYKLTDVPDNLPAGIYTATRTQVTVDPDGKITIKAKFNDQDMEKS